MHRNQGHTLRARAAVEGCDLEYAPEPGPVMLVEQADHLLRAVQDCAELLNPSGLSLHVILRDARDVEKSMGACVGVVPEEENYDEGSTANEV